MSSSSSAPYVLEPKVSIAQLDASVAFATLTSAEAKYALALAKSQWAGAKICLLQCSAESAPTFALLRLIFAPGAEAVRASALAAGVSDADYALFSVFAATFSDNLGNFKSFGDTKFIPGCPASIFETVLRASPAYSANASKIDALWGAVREPLYALEPARVRQLGFGPEEGVSTYYSADVSRADAELVQRFSDSLKLTQLYNSRVFKTGPAAFQVRLASALPATEWADAADAAELRLGTHVFEGATIEVVRGDYAPLLRRVVAHLEEALPHAANDRQREMLRLYASSFRRGSMLDHISGSAEWVKDVGPAVESYQGFIESYRDPLGVRGEWEGFVAVVNKQTSAKFGALVAGAEELLKLMPWPAVFEKDTFLRPDFTALEVLAFPSSGIPAGERRKWQGGTCVCVGGCPSLPHVTSDPPPPRPPSLPPSPPLNPLTPSPPPLPPLTPLAHALTSRITPSSARRTGSRTCLSPTCSLPETSPSA
jgi:dipeptidyl-peptidase III